MREKEVKDKRRKLRLKLNNFERLEQVEKDKLRDIEWQKELLANRKEETEQKISDIEDRIEDLKGKVDGMSRKFDRQIDDIETNADDQSRQLQVVGEQV